MVRRAVIRLQERRVDEQLSARPNDSSELLHHLPRIGQMLDGGECSITKGESRAGVDDVDIREMHGVQEQYVRMKLLDRFDARAKIEHRAVTFADDLMSQITVNAGCTGLEQPDKW